MGHEGGGRREERVEGGHQPAGRLRLVDAGAPYGVPHEPHEQVDRRVATLQKKFAEPVERARSRHGRGEHPGVVEHDVKRRQRPQTIEVCQVPAIAGQ